MHPKGTNKGDDAMHLRRRREMYEAMQIYSYKENCTDARQLLYVVCKEECCMIDGGPCCISILYQELHVHLYDVLAAG